MEPTDTVPAPPSGLASRARAAFVFGRLRLGAWAAVRAALLPALVLLVGHGTDTVLVCGPLLVVCAAGFAFYGRAPGRVVSSGLIAATVVVAFPLVTRVIGHACDSSVCMSLCLPACGAGGLIAGFVLGLRAREEPPHADGLGVWRALAAGAVLAAIAAPMGCAMVGNTGLLIAAAGLVAGTTPVLARART